MEFSIISSDDINDMFNRISHVVISSGSDRLLPIARLGASTFGRGALVMQFDADEIQDILEATIVKKLIYVSAAEFEAAGVASILTESMGYDVDTEFVLNLVMYIGEEMYTNISTVRMMPVYDPINSDAVPAA